MGGEPPDSCGSFVTALEELVRDFYHDVVQDLKPYVEPAPRIVAEPDSGNQPRVEESAATPSRVQAEDPALEQGVPSRSDEPAHGVGDAIGSP